MERQRKYVLVRKCFQFTEKGGDACCILNFNTKGVKELRTLETDRKLSYISPATG